MHALQSLRRKLSKSLTTRGFSGTVAFAAKAVLRSAGNLDPRKRREHAAQAALDEEFDRRHGVDTGGVIPLSELNVAGESWMYGSRYEAVGSNVDFSQIMGGLEMRCEDFVFIDLGSGKGRGVLLASTLAFQRVIGVELAQDLHQTALENLRRWPKDKRRCGQIELLCANAADYRFPHAPLVLFMYNPFDRSIMERVVRNVAATFEEHPRRIVVLYFTPKVQDLWEDLDFLKLVRAAPGYVVFDVAAHYLT